MNQALEFVMAAEPKEQKRIAYAKVGNVRLLGVETVCGEQEQRWGYKVTMGADSWSKEFSTRDDAIEDRENFLEGVRYCKRLMNQRLPTSKSS